MRGVRRQHQPAAARAVDQQGHRVAGLGVVAHRAGDGHVARRFAGVHDVVRGHRVNRDARRRRGVSGTPCRHYGNHTLAKMMLIFNNPMPRCLEFKALPTNPFGNPQQAHERRSTIRSSRAITRRRFFKQCVQASTFVDRLDHFIDIGARDLQRGIGGIGWHNAQDLGIDRYRFIGTHNERATIICRQIDMAIRGRYQNIAFEDRIADMQNAQFAILTFGKSLAFNG